MSNLALVDETWETIGYRVRPLRNTLFVRTDPPPQKIQGSNLFLPANYQTFYGELPAKITTYATVIGVGPKVLTVKLGDRVAFTRIYFARWLDFDNGVKIGWVTEDQLLGLAEEE